MRVMFRMHRLYQIINSLMELYVDFKKVVACASLGHIWLTSITINLFIIYTRWALLYFALLIFISKLICIHFIMIIIIIIIWGTKYALHLSFVKDLVYQKYILLIIFIKYYSFYYYYYYYYMRYKIFSILASCWGFCVSEILYMANDIY